MKRITAFLLLVVMLAVLSACTPQALPPQPTQAPTATAAPTAAPTAAAVKQSQVGFYFDTVVTVTLYDGEKGLMEEIFEACNRYENMLSKTVAQSDVSRINAAGGETVTVDPETWDILRRAKEISRMTEGAFAVTIAPITAMWDFTGGTQRMPTDEERLAALPLIDDSAILLGENNTGTLPAGMEIDLGGIAKGYIADKVAELTRGRASGVVLSLGGNVYVLGTKPDGSKFNVGVQDPSSVTGAYVAVIQTTDQSVVTSGIYERNFEKDGVVYHHILDPKDGLPSRSDLASATIVNKSSMDADALATALIVLGKDKALQLMAEHGIEGVLITREGEIGQQQTTDTYQLTLAK